MHKCGAHSVQPTCLLCKSKTGHKITPRLASPGPIRELSQEKRTETRLLNHVKSTKNSQAHLMMITVIVQGKMRLVLLTLSLQTNNPNSPKAIDDTIRATNSAPGL